MKIKLRYIYEEVDRYGKSRIYFRAKGKTGRILMPHPSSPEFAAGYAAALAGLQRPAPKTQMPPAPLPLQMNTLRWLCSAYTASPEFRQLDPGTQRVRRQIIEHCLREPIAPGAAELFSDFPVDRITPKAIRVLRDRKAEFPEAGNGRVKALRQVFAWGLEAQPDLLTTNPARDVPYLKPKETGGFHSWAIEEVHQFEDTHPIGSRARLAFALLLYTGQRRSDVVRLGRQHVRDGWLRFTQHKGRKRKPITLEIPIRPELGDIIDASPTGDLTFLVNEFGRPFTDAGFGNRFRKWCDEAGLSGCSAHGLRKAAAARLAEAGASDREIMAVTGHRTAKEVDRYTRAARQRVLAGAAMARFGGPFSRT